MVMGQATKSKGGVDGGKIIQAEISLSLAIQP